MQAHTVFICHSSKDVATAKRLSIALKAQGINSWLAPLNIHGGDEYADAIVKGIRACDTLLVLLSEEANRSPFVQREVERAASQSKRLIAFRLAPVKPERGLELFLSGTQWIEAHSLGFEAALEHLSAALRRDVASRVQKPTAPSVWRQRARPAVVGLLVLAVSVGTYLTWSDPWGWRDSPPAKNPATTALAVMAAARTGDANATRALFSEQARSRQPLSRWQAMAATWRADLETATATAEHVLLQPVASRATGMGTGSYFMVQSQRPREGGYLCEQVLFREELSRWAAESYIYWPSPAGACLGKADIDAATARAQAILTRLLSNREVIEDDRAETPKRLAVGTEWDEYLVGLLNMLGAWQPDGNVIAAAPLPWLPQGLGMPNLPGRIVQVRLAVDRDGINTNLDLFLMQERDTRWRLAALNLSPNAS